MLLCEYVRKALNPAGGGDWATREWKNVKKGFLEKGCQNIHSEGCVQLAR